MQEFKAAAASEKEKLPDFAEQALKQMKDHSYTMEMKERSVNRIVCYGIAFAGKDACVRISR